MSDEFVRLTANLSVDAALSKLANLMGVTKTQALNQALETACHLYEAQDRGGQIVIRYGRRAERKVTLPKPPRQNP